MLIYPSKCSNEQEGARPNCMIVVIPPQEYGDLHLDS